MSTILHLRSDHVVLGDTPGHLRVVPARLRIEGAWIREVAEEGPDSGPFEGTDLGTKLLSPAFVNAHTHLALVALRGLGGAASFAENVVEELYYRVETAFSAEDVAVFTQLGALESLLHGVGLVWDHYYHGRVVAEAIAEMGLAAVVAPTLQDLDGPGQEAREAQFDATCALDDDAGLRERGIAAAFGPHATDTVSAELWGRIADAAADRELPVHAHVAQSDREFRRAVDRHGLSPVAWLDEIGVLDRVPSMLLVHGVFVRHEDLARLDPARHVMGYCPYSQVHFAYPADVAAWEAAGVPWFLATDCAASNDSMNLQKEMRFAAGVRGMHTMASTEHAAFLAGADVAVPEARRRSEFDRLARLSDPAYLLSRVWSVPGAMHARMPAGVLAPGALANLVIWDQNHPSFWPARDPLRALALNDTTGAIHGMMVAGRWRGECGRFHASLLEAHDYPRLCAHAHERMRRLSLSDRA